MTLLVSLVYFTSCNSHNHSKDADNFTVIDYQENKTTNANEYNAADNQEHHNGSSITGTWKEYRDNGDDYLLSSYTFYSDGSGVFKVEGLTNTQRVPYTWSLSGDEIYIYYEDGSARTLSYNQGLIIEHSNLSGDIVFKKQ